MSLPPSRWCSLWHGWLPFFSGIGGESLGLLVLMMLLLICLRVLWVVIPLIFFSIGMSLRVLTGIQLLIGCLFILMFGLMVVLFVMRFLALLLLVLVFMLVCMLTPGGTDVGGQFDDLGLTPDGLASSCVGFSSLPGPSQTVQRAEFWGVI